MICRYVFTYPIVASVAPSKVATFVRLDRTISTTISPVAATVMICGKPAARMGDTTAHGGQIVLGCPTVIIGG